VDHIRPAVAIVGSIAAAITLSSVKPPARFVDMAVCAYGHYSLAIGACTTNQQKRTLISTRFACSATVVARVATKVRMQWRYDSVSLPAFHQSFQSGSWVESIELDSGQPDGPLPGGDYQCRFSDGTVISSASFTSAGPTGPVVDITVCNSTFVFRYKGFPVCKHDESSIPIASPSSILCEGTFPNSRGTAEIEVVDPNGVDHAPPDSHPIDGALEQIDETVHGPFTPGSWSCNFGLNGQIVAKKAFQIVQ
jgi:hypothetical protein